MNLFNIEGKKAIVTGAAQGLGNGIAEGLMEAGVEVSLVDISKDTNKAVDTFRGRGFKCHGVNADLADKSELVRAFDESVKNLGGDLDIIVNAAGIQKRHLSEKFPFEDWLSIIDINLNAVFMLCQLVGQQFINQNSCGKIINIASVLSFFGGYTVPAYAASKGGVAQLTKALSNEWASKGINVNALAPGYIDTEMNVDIIKDTKRRSEILARIPAKRWGTPTDMKGAAVFLASNASNYINGAIIPVDGGYMSR
ncbi:MAG: SDR family oxidoreductase [Tindallia sp. MSAO_Bac2]|nr:MAG: SDR family oxidoreductase [Tindallia sp. MSAO_Bac2]